MKISIYSKTVKEKNKHFHLRRPWSHDCLVSYPETGVFSAATLHFLPITALSCKADHRKASQKITSNTKQQPICMVCTITGERDEARPKYVCSLTHMLSTGQPTNSFYLFPKPERIPAPGSSSWRMDHGLVTQTSRAGPWKAHHHCVPRERNDCNMHTCLRWRERWTWTQVLWTELCHLLWVLGGTMWCQLEHDFSNGRPGGERGWSGFTLCSILLGLGNLNMNVP